MSLGLAQQVEAVFLSSVLAGFGGEIEREMTSPFFSKSKGGRERSICPRRSSGSDRGITVGGLELR